MDHNRDEIVRIRVHVGSHKERVLAFHSPLDADGTVRCSLCEGERRRVYLTPSVLA